ncbi:MAG: hypothetical protein ACPG60_02035 [Poseidonia sp.]
MGASSSVHKPHLALFIAFMFLLPLANVVQASGGSVLIEDASFGLVNYQQVNDENLSFTVELHEMDAGQANVSLSVIVSSMEGVEISNTTTVLNEFSASEQRNVSLFVENLSYGYSNISVSLEGDYGVDSPTHMVSISRIIQRLRPLSITLGGTASITAEGIDESGIVTGNLTLHDGDFIRIEAPIVNEGDVGWVGDVHGTFSNDEVIEEVHLENLSVGPMSSTIAVFEPSQQLREGTLFWTLNLSGVLGDAHDGHQRNGSYPIQPPPLPVMGGEITSNADEVNAGGQLQLNYQLWNNGTVGFSGSIQCQQDGVLHVNQSASISAGTSQNFSFTMVAKPLLMSCDVSNSRVDASSMLPSLLSIEMPSAAFESAGSTTPSLSGGPWHKGDTVQANLLMRNMGDLPGRVRLVLQHSDVKSEGDWVELEDGSAGEISTSFTLTSTGSVPLEWKIESDNGLVSAPSNGSVPINVAMQQSVHIGLENLQWSATNGVTFNAQFTLDTGKSREVLVQMGYETGDSTIFIREQVMTLEQGSRHEAVSFGHIDAEKVVIQLSPVNWLIGPGPLSLTSTIPDSDTQYRLDIGQVTSPIRPVQGNSVTITVNFAQSGPVGGGQGDLRLVDSYGTILATIMSPAWNGDDAVSSSVDVIWPKGNTVIIQAIWQVDGQIISSQTSFTSGQVAEETGMEWPIGALIWGIVAGAGISLVLRLRYRSDANKEESSGRPKQVSTSPSESPHAKEEKKEVACPECDRRLRVPLSYSGSVGCPDCSHKFRVEGESVDSQSSMPASQQETPSPTPEPKVETKTDGKIEVSCPDCHQSLRIPGSYTGSVRCPACTKIFKAAEGLASQ